MRTNPRPNARSIGAFYPDDYGPYLETAVGRSAWWRSALRRLVDPLDVAIPELAPGRLLEIGTATGNYALDMRRRGWDVIGVELDATAASRAAARLDCPVLCGDILEMDFEEDRYDLICAWMTIEHLRNPVRAVERCYDWLRPGGWLAFSVPDCGGWQFRLFRGHWFATQLPTHLFHFTPAVLREVLRTVGYTQVTVRWQRTLFDVPISMAYLVETRWGARAGKIARAMATSTLCRAAARGLGSVAAPFRLTGRLTVWARKPVSHRR